MLVRWVPAQEGSIKLNVDGSSRGNPGPAGCGGLFRDEKGNWIIGFTSFIGFAGSLFAELMAIRNGLSIAWDLGYEKVECESDCLMAIQILYDDSRDFQDFYIERIVDEIDDLMDRQWEVTLRYVHREANSCADFLAKIGSLSSVALDVLTVPHEDLSPLLLADSRGVLFSRS